MTMKLNNRIEAFSALGTLIRSFSEEELASLTRKSSAKNNWFTEENVRFSLESIARFLEGDKLKIWLSSYNLEQETSYHRKVGLVLAGNTPLAGFHDFLSILIAGHELYAKLSPQDPVLLPFLANELFQIEPEFEHYLHFEERLKNMDAMIINLGDHSPRYYEHYFKKTPHIIRKTRHSCAVLDGTESKKELEKLGEDITLYYGLSSRNVSKLFVPEGYNFTPLFEALTKFEYLRDHHKFVNNYDYNKSIYLINGNPHLDTGFLLFKEDKNLFSPISVVFYEYYSDQDALQQSLKEKENLIDSIVGHQPLGEVSFGEAHKPEVWEYARKEDALKFLQNL